MKKAFTLIEVNLAIMVMAVGVLSIISLYALGYREERQSREDVASAAYADAVMGPLVTALTATNVKWSAFKDLNSMPAGGWKAYLANERTGRVISDCRGPAQSAYADAIKVLPGFQPSSLPTMSGFDPALVIIHDEDSSIVSIALRVVAKKDALFSAPLYYTEARFQGVVDE